MNAITREQVTALLANYHIKSHIKRDLRFVPEKITDWPDRDFIAVMNKSQSKGVLIAPFEQMYIAPFELHRRKPNANGRTEAIICDLCKTWQRGSNSAAVSFQRDRSSVTFLCCADLDCSLHVRNLTSAARLSRVQIRESNSIEERVERLRNKLNTIFESSRQV
jgi:treble-clef zinc-finger protein